MYSLSVSSPPKRGNCTLRSVAHPLLLRVPLSVRRRLRPHRRLRRLHCCCRQNRRRRCWPDWRRTRAILAGKHVRLGPAKGCRNFVRTAPSPRAPKRLHGLTDGGRRGRYLQYLELCSRIVRYSLKEPLRAVAIKRGELGLKSAKWTSGKQGEVSKICHCAAPHSPSHVPRRPACRAGKGARERRERSIAAADVQ